MHVAKVIAKPMEAFEKLTRRGFIGVNAEKVAGLRGNDRHRDAGGEAAGHRPWDVFDERTHFRQPHDHQDHPGHHRGHQQSGVAVFFDDQ
jgi:hypothetical protein